MDPEKVVDDPFSAAFDEIAAAVENKKPDEAGGEKAPAAAAEKVAPAAAEPGTEIDPGAGKTPEQIAAEAAAEAAKTPEQKAADEAARVAAEAAATEAARVAGEKKAVDDAAADQDLVRRLAGLVKTAEPIKPAVVEKPTPVAPPPFSKAEAESVEAYVNEFPDVARNEAIIRRVEAQAIVQHIFAEFNKEFQPVKALIEHMASRTHLGDIKALVPDYELTRDKVVDWIETQPEYLKVAYQNVVQNGSKDDVADLINRYKTAVGQTIVAGATAAATAPAAKVVDPKVAAAAAALAPVAAKRASSGVVAEDPANFDAAFDKFAAAAE